MGLCGSSEPAQAPASKQGDGAKVDAKSEADKPLVAGVQKERSKSISGRMAEAPGEMAKPAPLLKKMSDHLKEQKGRNSMYGTSRPHKLTLLRAEIEDGNGAGKEGTGKILKKISSRLNLGEQQGGQGSMSAAATFDIKGSTAGKKYVRKKRKLSIALADHIHDQNEEAYVQHSVNVKQKNSGKLDKIVKGSLANKLQEELEANAQRLPSAKFLEGEPLVAGSLLGHEEVKAIEAERENEIKRAKTKRAEAGKNAFHDSGRIHPPGHLTVESIPKSDKEAIGGRSIAKTPWRINQKERRVLIDGLITPGYDPTGHAKECQDNLLIDQGFHDTSAQLVILADGHGKQGAVAAMFAEKRLCEILKELPKEQLMNDTSEAFVESFLKTDAVMQESWRMLLSGTTITTIFINGDQMLTSWCGDSRAVLYRNNKKGVLKAYPLTTDHTPEVPEERERIEESGGEVRALDPIPGVEDNGPLRVYEAGGFAPGLAMTRSFGDHKAHLVGCIALPEQTLHKLTPRDQFVVIASDGLWEVVGNEEIGEICKKHRKLNCREISRKLAERAHEGWRQMMVDEGGLLVVDDCAIAVLKFNL